MAGDLLLRIPHQLGQQVEDDAELLKAVMKIGRLAFQEPGQWSDNGGQYEVGPGQFITTLSRLADLLGVPTAAKARAILGRGERLGVFATKTVWPVGTDSGTFSKHMARTQVTLVLMRVSGGQAHSQPSASTHIKDNDSSNKNPPPAAGYGENVYPITTKTVITADWWPSASMETWIRRAYPTFDLDRFIVNDYRVKLLGKEIANPDTYLKAWIKREHNPEVYQHGYQAPTPSPSARANADQVELAEARRRAEHDEILRELQAERGGSGDGPATYGSGDFLTARRVGGGRESPDAAVGGGVWVVDEGA